MVVGDNDAGAAMYSLTAAKPGDSISKCIKVTYTGSLDADVHIYTPSTIGSLGQYVDLTALRLTIRDVTAGSEAIVFSGPFGALGATKVGALAPGERRRYSFTAILPDAGTIGTQDSFAGARTSVDYRWSLTGAPLARCATRLSGEGRANRLIGTIGGDRIDGGAGADRIHGRGGDDCLSGGAGRDRVYGGSGDDSIQVRHGIADLVDCGSGEDVAAVDPKDSTRGCEPSARSSARPASRLASGGGSASASRRRGARRGRAPGPGARPGASRSAP